MTGLLLVAGTGFAALAALIHVAFFVAESVLWDRPAVWRAFGLRSPEAAQVMKPMAFNQGFYNLFLAIGVGVGLFFIYRPGLQPAGFALALFALASMLLAAIVLVTSNPRLVRGALIQGAPALLGLGLLAGSAV